MAAAKTLDIKAEVTDNGVLLTDNDTLQKYHSSNLTNTLERVENFITAETKKSEPGVVYTIKTSITKTRIPRPKAD